MSYQRTEIPESDIQHQLDICAQLRAHFTAGGRQPLAMVDTYGCQQNEADSEKLRGYLRAMGFDFTQDEFAADVVVMNTCAVREHAETRVFGNVGALTHTKARNPNQIIAVCGCMAQQAHVAEKLKKSYRIVDLVFGPHELWRFPELLRTVCTEHRRVFAIAPADGSVAEGIPQQRDGSVKAWLSIMYGCNNFCTYCIVPYVRGRERSRHPDEIVREARELVAAGYKDITLLGQNVDSYGRDLDEDVDFADLIRRLNAIPGDFVIRFMSSHPKEIPESDIQRQLDICAQLRAHFSAGGRQPLAMVDTYGCQQNEADSEKLRGYLRAMGFGFTQDEFAADVVVMNTCAVREHAETRVFGNVGALTHTKARNPEQIIAVCGCMAQQAHVAEKLKKSYRIVDLVFGPHELWRFPELLHTVCTEHRRVFAIDPADGSVVEGIPRQRDGSVKAWLSIMYGCNNFCTYCIVPYVRGRERSRHPEEIVREARELVAAGYKDITLLGQNVDSYGRDLDEDVDFADLIRSINAIPGDFVIRFMSSHPKDATEKLFRAMAECEKCAHQMHLPVQSGNDRVLHAMNRGYTREKYLAQVALARQYMPDLVLTTDIIVGFPGETDAEFDDTLSLIETVRYDAMFTFIYSPRVGTPAAKMPDPYTRAQKQVRFDALVAAANRISEEKHRAYEGSVQRVLVDGADGRGDHPLTARTKGGRLVHMRGDASLVGQFVDVKITGSNTWALYGEEV